ncbi:MAG: choice-of-anchor B family protein [Bacteroidota bacterium]
MKNNLPTILLLLLFPIFTIGQAKEANLLGRWFDNSLVGSNNHDNAYNEIWGYATKGYEYAIIGSTAGTHFIDVTDPQNPFEAHFVAGAVQGGVIIHRDFHDYQGYLYAVADEGNRSTLQIMDLRNLPESVNVVYDQSDIFRTAHNIFIDSLSAKLYALSTRGDANGYAPMRVFDLGNPTQPIEIGAYRNFGGIRPSHVHDAYVEDDIAFLNLGFDGMAIVDFRNMDNPTTLGTVTSYPNQGYNHSGWLAADCSHYYMADENHGFDLKVINTEALCDPEVGQTFDAEVDNPTSITHNQVVACDYLYVSYYYDGLRVYDISDAANPELVQYYDTYELPNGRQYRGAWGVYPFLPSGNILVSDMQSGLFVFESMGDNCASQRSSASSCVRSRLCQTTSTTNPLFLEAVDIFPNPIHVSTSLIVNLPATLSDLQISLHTTDGQQLQNWQFDKLTVQTGEVALNLPESLSKGVYLLSLRSTSFVATKKLVVAE